MECGGAILGLEFAQSIGAPDTHRNSAIYLVCRFGLVRCHWHRVVGARRDPCFEG